MKAVILTNSEMEILGDLLAKEHLRVSEELVATDAYQFIYEEYLEKLSQITSKLIKAQ